MKNLDLLQIDKSLTTQQLKLRDEMREFVDSQVLPSIAENFELGQIDRSWFKDLVRLKAIGPTIKGYGAPSLDYVSYGLLMRELERADSGLRSFSSVQGALAMYAIAHYANDSIKAKYLPQMAELSCIGCFGLTEPEIGSNPSRMKTTAQKVPGGYVLSGEKKWMTNGLMAHIAVIWAADSESKKIKGFVIPTNTTGFLISEIKGKWSLKVGPSAQAKLEQVFVPDDHVLISEGLRAPFSCLNVARFGISWGVLGAQRACIEEVIDYTTHRSQFDKPLAQHQLIQAKIVEAWTELTKSQLLALHVGQLMNSGDSSPEMVSVCKMNNVSQALKSARLMRDCLGANGILLKHHTGRHMLNLETVNTYEGTEDIHRLVIGQSLTGLSAFL